MDQLRRPDIGILHQDWFSRIGLGDDGISLKRLVELAAVGIDIPLLHLGLGHQFARGFLDQSLELEGVHRDEFLFTHRRKVVAPHKTVKVLERLVVFFQFVVALSDLKERTVGIGTSGSQEQHLLEVLNGRLVFIQFIK
ncbi:MAG: hypothetical protein JW395_3910 [Nitrospira sp.]|nr:hypothetical protein [Nitrospira sp.]